MYCRVKMLFIIINILNIGLNWYQLYCHIKVQRKVCCRILFLLTHIGGEPRFTWLQMVKMPTRPFVTIVVIQKTVDRPIDC